MKDDLNMKVAHNPLTEHICCIVPADYIFVCLIFSNKVQASTVLRLCIDLSKPNVLCADFMSVVV